MMADMTFKFTIQPYQTEAVDSVAGVFAGQPFHDRAVYLRSADVQRTAENWRMTDEELRAGYANSGVELSPQRLLENIRSIQARNQIRLEDKLADGLGACSLDVEMETGTGKTYVYIKTMFELNKRYGWSKFIVVVPSIAIREGVRKSFAAMGEHFMEHYGKKARFFVYDSKNLEELDQFSRSAGIHVMIINTQAFYARGKDARRIRTELDAFGSQRPIDVLKAARPILILDEPQKMGGSATQQGLREFDPLFCLNYSATHKQRHNLVYVLDALDACNRRLVKRIEVKGFSLKNLRGTDGYLFLEGVTVSPDKPPAARLELEIRHKTSIKRETRIVSVGSDLYALSKNMEQYRGFRVSDVDPIRGTVSFANGETVRAGEASGDVSETDLRRVQIRETIRSHFEKEQELFARGVKTLSLFFIDEVAKYRRYDEDGNEVNSEYGEMFEQEYAGILSEYLTKSPPSYEQYLRGIKACETHAGYFSIDKKGRKINGALKRGSDESDDISAYELILKDKERLLSLRNPVRFLFSHSALREGWDNPNVFQICTLKRGGSSPAQKRQEVGRGLRLCVDQNGDRMDADTLGARVQYVNRLTVIAAEGYREFAADLQRGIREDLYERPDRATAEYFIGKTVKAGGTRATVSEKQGRDLYRYLVRNDYIDDDDRVTERYRAAFAGGELAPLPESCAEISQGIHALVRSVFDGRALEEMIHDGRETMVSENPLNENFYKKEFQALWNRINHKYAYAVELDSEELIRRAAAHIDKNMSIAKPRYTVTSGEQEQDWNADMLKSGGGFTAKHSKTFLLERPGNSSVKYDLIGMVAEGTRLTRRSAARILAGIKPRVFAMLKDNPEEFLSNAVRLINEQKAVLSAERIVYRQIEGSCDSTVFTAEKNMDLSRAYPAKKHVQNYVFTDGYARDGQSIERRFVQDLDSADEVCVYAKLPKGFFIPTPVGNYSPDWAIVFRQGTVPHPLLVVETKGAAEDLNLRPVEKAKIDCAKQLFAQLFSGDVAYRRADSYQHLLDSMDTV